MKYILITFFLFTCSGLVAQDSLFLNNGTVVAGYVESIDENQVTYARKAGQRAIFKVQTENVAYILFADGTRDNLMEFRIGTIARTDLSIPDDSLQAYQMGRQHGFNNYQNKSVKTATAITTFILPPVGLATTISTSATPPLRTLTEIKIENPDYRQGYLDGALLKKRKNAWGGFGLGIGILVGTVAILSAASN